ncbi:MAG: hypothetical protein HYX28_04230 [Candidatus Koribacter versatilis]|uniref:Uncharacterized protein n=1 Tax=Candidatus Korobacter versatilis TaxID=658062 RepID=A0A932EPQ6_9BACT|nr:hypothetical protein [Candidatus Koribacter versatilis]
MRIIPKLVCLFASLLLGAGMAQDVVDPQEATADAPSAGRPKTEAVPILTGYATFVSSFSPGEQQLSPTVAPILLIPFGDKWLIEAEGEFEGDYMHTTGEPWEREWEKGVEYVQVDYLANKYLTVVGGRFLTPFGIYNERLHPSWIKNLQTMPLIMPLEEGSGNGIQFRGGVRLGDDVNFNYATYFSAASAVRAFKASRAAGFRTALFFPRKRVEVGVSYQRTLQDENFNTVGIDFTWQPKAQPFDFRAEYANSELFGQGYWLEGAYRLRRVPFARKFFRRSQVIARVEQYFVPEMGMGGGGERELPESDTTRFTVGWNYYFRDDLKLAVAGGRSFSTDGDRNVESIGLAYRFTIPLAGGK